MKRMTKLLLKTAFIFLITGAAFGVASLCLGFRPVQFRDAIEEGRFELIGSSAKNWSIREWIPGWNVGEVDVDQTYEDVRLLDLDVGAADCRIIVTDEDTWKVTGYNVPSGFRYEQSGKILKINSRVSSWGIWNLGRSDAQLEIRIPGDQIIDTLEIDMGAGNLTVEDGVIKCKKLDVNCGMGNCSIRADIRKEGSIDAGVGNIDLTLTGDIQDFDYEIDCGIGRVDIGDEHYSNLGTRKIIDNHASGKLDIDCGVGSVNIDFE